MSPLLGQKPGFERFSTKIRCFTIPSLGRVNKTFVELNKKFVDAMKKFVELNKEFVDAMKKFVELNKEFVDAMKKFVELNKKFVDAMKKFVEFNKEFVDAMKKFVDANSELVDGNSDPTGISSRSYWQQQEPGWPAGDPVAGDQVAGVKHLAGWVRSSIGWRGIRDRSFLS